MELFCEQFTLPTINDLVKEVLGKRLGAGVYRTVYATPLDPSVVIKIANAETGVNFANAKEWEVWEEVQETDFKHWFAPCVSISDVGTVLIQKRTAPVTIAELYKEMPRVPKFFTDLKVSNWGRFEDRIVCHDYGNHLLFQRGLTKALKLADWWE